MWAEISIIGVWLINWVTKSLSIMIHEWLLFFEINFQSMFNIWIVCTWPSPLLLQLYGMKLIRKLRTLFGSGWRHLRHNRLRYLALTEIEYVLNRVQPCQSEINKDAISDRPQCPPNPMFLPLSCTVSSSSAWRGSSCTSPRAASRRSSEWTSH